MPRPFAVAGFTVFITVFFLGNCETGVMIYALSAFLIALVVTLLIRATRTQRVFPLSMMSGALACLLLLSFNIFEYNPIIAYDGQTAFIKAQLTDYPQLRYGNVYCDAQVISLDGEPCDMKIRLTFPESPDAEPFDYVEGSVKFYRPGFTAEEYLNANKSKGIYLGAYSLNSDFVFTSVPQSEKPFMYHIVQLRRAIKNAVYRALPDDSGALATALLIGDKSDMTSQIYNDFVDSGVVHIICVSGFHLSFWANLILDFFRKLGLNIKVSSVFAAAGVLLFMFVAGFTPSVLRSGIMTLLYLGSNVLSRKRDSLNSLGFALIVLAIYNPMIIGSIGLQLSALSTLGIILYNSYISPKVSDFFSKFGQNLFVKTAESLVGSLCLTAGAVIFIQPVSLLAFGSFSFVVFISNIIVTWVAGIAMVLSAFAAAASFVVAYEYNIFAYFAGLFLQIILKSADVFSDVSAFMFSLEYDKAAFLLALVFIFCSAVFFCAYCGKTKPVMSVVLCFSLFSFGITYASVTEREETCARVIDTGNATAVCVSKNGENVLVGCGSTEFDSSFAISTVLEQLSGNLDVLILPDSSAQTSSEAVQIIKDFSPGVIYSGGLTHEASLVAPEGKVKPLLEEYKSENFVVKSGYAGGDACTFLETGDVSFLVLYNPVNDFSLIPQEFLRADILVTRGDYPDGDEIASFDFVVLNSGSRRGVAVQNELLNLGVNCVATAGCGDVIIRSSGGAVSVYRD